MHKLEPALITVPDSLIVTVILESLSITVKYLEENLLGEITNCHTGRPLIGVAISTFQTMSQMDLESMTCCDTYRWRALEAARVSIIGVENVRGGPDGER